MSRTQLVIEYLNGQTRYYPADDGWSKDPLGCCLMIGRGLPRTHIPLGVIAAYRIERADKPTDPVVGKLAKWEQGLLDTIDGGRQNALEKVREMCGVQGRHGTWDYSPYMRGMYNGMEFVLSILEGERAPVYRDEPETYLCDLPVAAGELPPPVPADLDETDTELTKLEQAQVETFSDGPQVGIASNPADWREPEPAPSGPVPPAQGGIVVTLSEPFPPAMGHAHREAARAEALRQRRIQGGGIR